MGKADIISTIREAVKPWMTSDEAQYLVRVTYLWERQPRCACDEGLRVIWGLGRMRKVYGKPLVPGLEGAMWELCMA